MRTSLCFLDGDEAWQRDLRLALAADYHIVHAFSCEGLLRELRDDADVVLVTDADTAAGQSYVLASVLRERFPTVPRILLCSQGRLQAAIRARNGDRVDAYLRKPCNADTLRAAVQEVVGAPTRKIRSRQPTAAPLAGEVGRSRSGVPARGPGVDEGLAELGRLAGHKR